MTPVKARKLRITKDTPCPNCGNLDSLREISYGMAPYDLEARREAFMGGCIMNGNEPEIGCLDCRWTGFNFLFEKIAKKKKAPKQDPHVVLTQRFFSAFAYATHAHASQVRKSTNLAYISHPMGVATLILEAGGDEDLAIAGLLHDVAEDCGGQARINEIEFMFGPRVGQIVLACSDSLAESEAEKADWLTRKVHHLSELREASEDTLVVTAADKLHNARAIATDLQISGVEIWSRFNASPDQIIWYYEEMLKVLQLRRATPVLLMPLENAIEVMVPYKSRSGR